MDYLIKKTNIGIACEESIHELGLEKYRDTIMGHLRIAFLRKFQAFKGGDKQSAPVISSLKGHYFSDHEYGIGKSQEQQYFRCNALQIKSDKLPKNSTSTEKQHSLTLIEGFSNKQEKKPREPSKGNSKKSRSIEEGIGRKKQKQT